MMGQFSCFLSHLHLIIRCSLSGDELKIVLDLKENLFGGVGEIEQGAGDVESTLCVVDRFLISGIVNCRLSKARDKF